MNNNMFSNMAHSQCGLMFEFIKKINLNSFNRNLIEYIQVNNNVASKTKNADEELQEDYKEYAVTDKELKVYTLLTKI